MDTPIHVNTTLLFLIDIAGEVVRPEGPEPSNGELCDLLTALIGLVERLAPERLGDPRVTKARAMLMVLEGFRD